MKKFSKALALLLAAGTILCLTACVAKKPEETVPHTTAGGTVTEPETTDGTQKPVLLVVSFGTSYNSSRELTIGAVETALQKAYPEYEVRRAFTSQIIIDKLKERDNLVIDNVTEAMKRLVKDGVTEVLVQPTHVMPGFEFDDMVAEVSEYATFFNSLKIGRPLLTADEDYQNLVKALVRQTEKYNNHDTAIVWMGHGTEHKANATYASMQKAFTDAGYTNYFVGTVEATPSLDDVLALVKASGAKKAVLLPMMIVAGDHANNDMAGDEEDSWKTAFKKAGFEVECVLNGLGQYTDVQDMIVRHAGETMAEAGFVTGSQVADGTYEIEVESSSKMFKITNCVLTVKDGKMTAVMTMSGDGYGKVFMGTGEQAAKADEKDFIPSVPGTDGVNTFEVPVDMLNAATDCAAWSIKKEKWYDRTLVFSSASIPAESLKLG